MNARLRSGWWTAAWLAAGSAQAGCSRPIEVPLAPVGFSVSFEGERSSGIYPRLLREIGAATGCEFRISRVPRARLQKMFESGQADLLAPAATSPAREVDGEFVPLIQVRPTLLTLDRETKAPHSLGELVAQRGFKLAVVRGFTYGAAYDRALATLRSQHRLIEEPDAAGVARALRQHLAHASIMASIMIGTLSQKADAAPLAELVHVTVLPELGWSESGLYLSRHSLGEADRRMLRTAFAQATRSGRVWQLYSESYPPGSLSGSARPLPP